MLIERINLMNVYISTVSRVISGDISNPRQEEDTRLKKTDLSVARQLPLGIRMRTPSLILSLQLRKEKVF